MNWGLPPDWSLEGGGVDRLIGWVHWLMLAIATFWLVYFAITLWRRRAGAKRARPQPLHRPWPLWFALAVFAFELGLMVFLEIPEWSKRQRPPSEERAFVVRAIGEQFAWNFHYPGADRVFGRTDVSLIDEFNPVGLDFDDPSAADDLVTINQLHVPLERADGSPQTVLLWLGAKDVIHNFYLPFFRVKQDVIPGHTTPVWFTPTREGVSEIGCAQLCGLGHFRMRGILTVESPVAFADWYEEELSYM